MNDIVGEAVSQPTSEEQQREERRQALAALRVASGTEVPPEEPALTVDEVGLFALGAIRDNGGSINRKQLTEILVKKFELRRQTVSSLISQWLKDDSVIEVNGMIHASDETALAF